MTSQYTQMASKRQKTTRDAAVVKVVDQGEHFFPGVATVEYRPDAVAEETLSYRFYNATERVHGRAMEDWLRPALSFEHAFPRSRAPGTSATGGFPWDEASASSSTTSSSAECAARRVRAAFELLTKLGWKLWTFHDRDVVADAPDDALDDAHRHLDDAVELIAELQLRTGVKPLWVAADLDKHTRYACGAATSPDAQVAAHAGAQLRKCLDVCQKLGADNFTFRGAHEGFGACALEEDVTRDLHAYSRMLKMAAAYKERIGFRGQLLLDASVGRADGHDGDFHRYGGDAMSALCLLKHFNLERNYKLEVAPGKLMHMAAAYGALGSIDLTGRASLPSIEEATMLMKSVIEQGGPQPGGLNIGVDLRGQLADTKELVTAYVAAVDQYARGLRNAAKLVADGAFAKHLQQRYLSFHTGFGSRLASGEASLEDCDEHARKQRCVEVSAHGRPRTQHWQTVFSRYL